MRSADKRLADILEAIERYTLHGRAAFEQDELIQTWIVHFAACLGSC